MLITGCLVFFKEKVMNAFLKFIKKNSLPIALIILGCFVFYWVRDYKQVPSGIGPSFFPKVVATMMIGFSLICIISQWRVENKGEVKPDRTAVIKIVISTTLLIASVLLMKYVHVIIGISIFLFGYLKLLSGEKWLKSTVISVVGTGLLYATILILRVPM